MLDTINTICGQLDCNRSQLIRRSLKEFIGFHQLEEKEQGEK